jgi:flagellar basal body-associated protein FliL
MITGSLGILLIVLGFVFALVSLSGVRRHGKKGILGRATAGLIINSIILALMIISIPMFKKMAERAKEIQKEKMEEQQTQP